jgi:hypothetical protein
MTTANKAPDRNDSYTRFEAHSLAGPGSNYESQFNRISARFVTRSDKAEAQLVFEVTQNYKNRTTSVIGSMELTPADAQALALAIAPPGVVLAVAVHGPLVASLQATRRAYGRLHELISECLESGRFDPADCKALADQLAGPCNAADAASRAVLINAGEAPDLIPFALIDNDSGIIWWVGKAGCAEYACEIATRETSGESKVFEEYPRERSNGGGGFWVYETPDDFTCNDGKDQQQINAVSAMPLVGYYRAV